MNIIKQNTDYALRAMIYLAREYGQKAVSVRVLSKTGDISYQFACKILQQLQGAKLVKSTMGPKGGYSLAKPPSKISLLEVLSAMQGMPCVNNCICLGNDVCHRKPNCPASEKMQELQNYIEKFMGSVTLGEFLENHSNKKGA